jgi:hypothetical protein
VAMIDACGGSGEGETGPKTYPVPFFFRKSKLFVYLRSPQFGKDQGQARRNAGRVRTGFL